MSSFPVTKSNQDRRRKPRVRIAIEVKAKVRLFGSNLVHDFLSENISESGILMTLQQGALHFNSASILEVTLIMKPGSKSENIFFVSKFVRQAGDKTIGAKIIEIDAENAKKLADFIATITKTHPEA